MVPLLVLLTVMNAACLPSTRATSPASGGRMVEDGLASYYADSFEGRATASGETFLQANRTAAHRLYPFGTMLRVTNLRNGLQTVVRVNDRGPFKEDRIVDLSRAAAQEIDMVNEGIARIRVEVLEWGSAR